MRRLIDVKKHIFAYFKKIGREKIAIFICLPTALIALLMCATLLLSAEKRETKNQNDEVYVTESITEKQTYSPDSPYGLEFESLDNGACAIVGIGSFSGNELKIPKVSPQGEAVTEIKSYAFKDCEHLESITLPSTVERIGVNAFKGCASLVYIDVDMDNQYFTSISGVLFSKNKTRLIYYPPKKTGERYYLNPNVRIIDDYAFEGVTSISAILYPNNTSDFEAISIGKGNDILRTLPITCNYVGENSGK